VECKRCNVENPPGSTECINCGAKLYNSDVIIIPPNIKKASVSNIYKRRVSAISGQLMKNWRLNLVPLTTKSFREYSGFCLASLIPTLGLFILKEYKRAIYYLLSIALLLVLIVNFIKEPISNVLIFLLVILLIYISYDGLKMFYKLRRGISVSRNLKIRLGILAFAVNIFVLSAIFFFFTQIYFLYYNFYEMPGNVHLLSVRNYRFFNAEEGDFVIILNDSYYFYRAFYNRMIYYSFGKVLAKPNAYIEKVANGFLINNNFYKPEGRLGEKLRKVTSRYQLKEDEYLCIYRDPYRGDVIEIIQRRNIKWLPIAVISPVGERRLL
jgi:hypothetical protein